MDIIDVGTIHSCKVCELRCCYSISEGESRSRFPVRDTRWQCTKLPGDFSLPVFLSGYMLPSINRWRNLGIQLVTRASIFLLYYLPRIVVVVPSLTGNRLQRFPMGDTGSYCTSCQGQFQLRKVVVPKPSSSKALASFLSRRSHRPSVDPEYCL